LGQKFFKIHLPSPLSFFRSFFIAR
jgi:hypothetical protein